jgi:hypothetical protein
MDKPTINFEQVPLEVVKEQIAKGEILLETIYEDSLEPQPEAEDIEDLKYPQWQAVLAEALIEVDPSKVKDRIAVAEAAIGYRLQTILLEPNNRGERLALADALSSLRVLKKEGSESSI